jgi:hypothetical protein
MKKVYYFFYYLFYASGELCPDADPGRVYGLPQSVSLSTRNLGRVFLYLTAPRC